MNRIYISLMACALVFIGMVVSAAMMYFQFGFSSVFSNAFLAAETVVNAEARNDDIRVAFFGARPSTVFDGAIAPARDDKVGVTRYNEEQSFNGFTLYSSAHGESVINLVDMSGAVVHQWELPLEQLFAVNPERGSWRIGSIHATPSHAYPNGDLLVVISVRGDTPWGYGVALIDKDSDLKWLFKERAHHDLDVAPDGKIYTLGHFVDQKPREGLEMIVTPFIDDTVIILDESGKKLREFSILDAIYGSDYEAVLRYFDPDTFNGDLLHVNSIQYVSAELAKSSSIANEGDVLLSSRNSSSLLLIDTETEKVVWAARGSWYLQHDPEFLANGNILLFDNQGDIANSGNSRVLEFDPETMTHVWEFPGDSGEILYSSVKSSQQRLANGNTLITETNNGRLLEVTPGKEVVWEFYIPERREKKNGTTVVKAVHAQRYLPVYFDKDLVTSR
jgi:outer membrane protein assembly factor BamB